MSSLTDQRLSHTPGPWTAHSYQGSENNYYVRGPNNERICGRGAGMVSGANAYLIASAPELYSALEALVEAVRFDVDKIRRIERAEDILARARGEA